MLYTDLTNLLGNYLEQEPPVADFTAALPTIVRNAELRIYRDLDLLATRGQNTSISFSAGNNSLNLSAITGQTVGGFPVAYPYPVFVERVAAQVGSAWIDFLPVSIDFLNATWPDPSATGVPGADGYPTPAFAMLDFQTVVVAPTPAGAYQARITGRWRPAVLSPTNNENWLGDNLPDLLFAAAMIEAAGWMRDYGIQSSDPKLAISWEGQYEAHKSAAIAEESLRSGYGRKAYPKPLPPTQVRQ